MKKYCPKCRLVNFPDASECARCQCDLITVSTEESRSALFLRSKLFRRVLVCVFVCIFVLLGFYISLIGSAKQLSSGERKIVQASIDVLEARGFEREAFLLNNLTAFRTTDNWLNASVVKENAYAATNFPFEIITVYPDFFNYPVDDTERAAIMLHEAQHLKGADEKEAYEFVWKNRRRLGWTKDIYGNSLIWRSVRKQTKEYAPELFGCPANELGDCTE